MKTYHLVPTEALMTALATLKAKSGGFKSRAILQLEEALGTDPIPAGQTPAEGPALPDNSQLYTCIGKGGEYEKLGYTLGAGSCAGQRLVVYRDTRSQVMYHREPVDFASRMEHLED